jgi:hypothetical protein
MSTKFLSPGWRMPRNANQSKQSNYSMDFDGTNYIDCGTSSSLDLPGNFTISFWFNADSFTNYPHILSKIDTNYYGWRIQLDATDIRLQSTTNSTYARFKASRPSNTNQWYSVIFTFDGTNVLYYLDGQATTLTNDGPTSTWITPVSSGKNFRIAKSPTIQPGFNGKIDGVAIFDYALSSSQITTLWGGGTSVSNPMALPSPPIAYYPLGESAGGFVGGSGTWLTENNAIGDYVFDFDSSLINPSVTLTELGISNEFSVSLWANVDTITSYRGPLGATSNGSWVNGFGIYINGNKWNFFVDNWSASKVTSDTTITVNTWVHLVGTFSSSGTGKLYINGVKEGTDFTGVTLDGLSNNFAIGNVYNGGGFFQGKMSNVQIWNKELIATEVETLYNYGSPIQTLASIPQNSNLKAWYKLDASEVYNSSTTEWEINNAQSAYQSSLNFSPRSSSNRVNLPSINLGTVNSISFWCRRLDQLSHKVLGSPTGGQNDPGLFAYIGTNVAYLSFGDGVNNYSKYFQTNDPNYTLLTSDDWIHFLIVRNGNTSPNAMALYINGQAITSFTASPTLSNDTILNTIGAGGITGYQNSANCDISNVSIFNSALGSTDANSLYNSGSPLSDMSSFSSLVSWWKLDNTSTGVQDSKGSNNATSVQANLAIGSVSTLNGESSGMTQSNLVQSDLQTVAPYSKYAMNFDGTDYINVPNDSSLDFGTNTDFTLSMWVKRNLNGGLYSLMFKGDGLFPAGSFGWRFQTNNTLRLYLDYGDTSVDVVTTATITDTNWHHLAAVADRGTAQIREIYNEGLPSDLNTFSGTAPVAWWQLGENSSYVGGWTFADEIASNNGTSGNLPEIALTNGVGTTANGVSSGMSEGNLVGDAPYSTANALSSNMAVTARVSGSGNTP